MWFFEVEELKTHYQNGSRLSGHVSHHLPGVDFSTGSLGHGLPAAAGFAYALKKMDARNVRLSYSEMANVMRVRYGKRHCSLIIFA